MAIGKGYPDGRVECVMTDDGFMTIRIRRADCSLIDDLTEYIASKYPGDVKIPRSTIVKNALEAYASELGVAIDGSGRLKR